MRRTTILTAAPLLGLALLTPITSAAAAGETCRGEAATIVGSGPTITGTEGRDVVVTNGATDIDTLGGDDLVCVGPRTAYTMGRGTVDLDAGAGDDVVEVDGGGWLVAVTAVLGVGADTYVGSPWFDEVITGTREGLVDEDADTVSTGDGDDRVTTGSRLAVSHDVVDAGAGKDSLRLESIGFAPDAVLSGGVGSDTLLVDIDAGDLAMDTVRGTLRGASGTASLSAMEGVRLTMAGNGTFTYVGTPAEDAVWFHPRGGTPTLDVATHGGDDEIVLEPATVGAGSRVDAGSGQDKLVAASRAGRLALHLKKDRLEIDGRTVVADSLKHGLLMAPEVSLVGDGGKNVLGYVGCEAELRSGAGSDELYYTSDNYFQRYRFDCVGSAVMSGGSGPDRLFGGPGADRMKGGSGRDFLRGRNSRDVLRGGTGRDTLYGHADNDDLRGGGGRDVLKGHGGTDDLRGGQGNDRLLGGGDRDRADGGQGRRDRCIAERERSCER